MNHLFNTSGILACIGKLTSNVRGAWGKMKAGRLLAHCIASPETGMRPNFPQRVFMGRIRGPLVKPDMQNERSMPENLPADKSDLPTDNRDSERGGCPNRENEDRE
jgi:hypothetical protein